MGTFANSKDQYEMQHNATFHQDLFCSLRLKQSSEIELDHDFEKFTGVTVTP